MSDESGACSDCFDTIAMKSIAAAWFWHDLCDIQRVHDKPVHVHRNSQARCEQYLWLLENLKFLVTTEDKDSLIIKLLGREGDKYCINNHLPQDSYDE